MTMLRQRMTEDMQVRNLSPHTQATYLLQVSLFAAYFHQSPDVLEAEHIRAYQLYLANDKKLITGASVFDVYRQPDATEGRQGAAQLLHQGLSATVRGGIEFFLSILADFGLNDFYLELSTRESDSAKKEKFIGSDEDWQVSALVAMGRARIAAAGLDERATIVHGDARTADIGAPTVALLFLPAVVVGDVVTTLRTRCPAGARLVAHEQSPLPAGAPTAGCCRNGAAALERAGPGCGTVHVRWLS